MSAYHITYYNNFKKNLDKSIKLISDLSICYFKDSHIYISYDIKLNYKLFAQSKELKYYFKIKFDYDEILVVYNNENDYYLTSHNKKIKNKLPFYEFINKYFVFLMHIRFTCVLKMKNFDLNVDVIDSILNTDFKSFYYFMLHLKDIDGNKRNYNNYLLGEYSNKNLFDIYFVKYFDKINEFFDKIKDYVSDDIKKEYDYIFNASNFDLV